MAVHNHGCEETPSSLLYGETAEIECEVSTIAPDLTCSFTILNHLAQRVCRFSNRVTAPGDDFAGGNRFTCQIAELPLVPGQYYVNVSIESAGELEDSVDSAIAFEVVHGSLNGRPLTKEQTGVVFAPRHRWTSPRVTP